GRHHRRRRRDGECGVPRPRKRVRDLPITLEAALTRLRRERRATTIANSYILRRAVMAQVTLGGNAVDVAGSLPAVGQKAPDFTLVAADLSDVTLASFAGKRKVLNMFPSIDTPTCAMSVRKFNA